jgi:hypothetical protein
MCGSRGEGRLQPLCPVEESEEYSGDEIETDRLKKYINESS